MPNSIKKTTLTIHQIKKSDKQTKKNNYGHCSVKAFEQEQHVVMLNEFHVRTPSFLYNKKREITCI